MDLVVLQTARGMETLVGLIVLGLIFALLAKWASNDGVTRFCGNCNQNIRTEKEFSWIIFSALLIVGIGVGGILYALYYTWVKDPRCPLCGGDYLGPPNQNPQQHQQQGQAQQRQGP